MKNHWDIEMRPKVAPFGSCFVCIATLTRWRTKNRPQTVARIHIVYRTGYLLVDEVTALILDARISLSEFFENLRASPIDEKLRDKIGKHQKRMIEIVHQPEPESSLYVLAQTARKKKRIVNDLQNMDYIREAEAALEAVSCAMSMRELRLSVLGHKPN